MSLDLIRKNKKALIVIAMVWMAIRHMYLPIEFKPFAFLFVNSGYGSVDMIIFILAFDLYFEFKSNDYKAVLKKKIVYLLKYMIPFFIVLMIIGKNSVYETICFLLGISIFTRTDLSYWLISLMFILYILSPVYYALFRKSPLITTLSFSLITILVCLTFEEYRLFYIYFRIIIFLLGLYLAYISENISNKKKTTLNYLLLFLTVIGWLLLFYLYHYVRNDIMHVYPFIFIIPGLCLLLSWIVDKLHINIILDKFSRYVLPFYLIHENIVNILYEHYGELFIPNVGFDWWINIASFIIALVLSIIMTEIVNLISKKTKLENICQ